MLFPAEFQLHVQPREEEKVMIQPVVIILNQPNYRVNLLKTYLNDRASCFAVSPNIFFISE